MILTFEVALPLGALAFYLYDSMLLVHDNELLLHRSGRRWFATQGSDWVLFGRRVCFPAPLMAWAPVLRAFWSTPRREATSTDWPSPDYLRALRPFQVLCTVLLVLLVVALPIASLAFGSGLVLLAVFAAYYLLVITALVWLFFRRARLGLATRAYWSLAVDCIACAPFAANLVRRVTLHHTLAGDALAYAEAHLRPDSLSQLQASVARKQAAP